MKSLNVSLAHCYGIKRLDAKFDFSNKRAHAIYASNGTMKSSLARVFSDVSNGSTSSDRIFTSRTSSRAITDENGQELKQTEVIVVHPYDETLEHSAKTSTLLVNKTLRQEYEALHTEIDSAKEKLCKALKAQAKTKRDVESELVATFSEGADFCETLLKLREEIGSSLETPLAELRYDLVFDEKVVSFLANKEVSDAIADYVTKYNELLAASTYFKKGTFNYFNAATVAKTLADNGFFQASHSVVLNAETKLELANEKELEALVAKEKEGISQDKALRSRLAAVEKLITKNASLREFEAYLGNHQEVLPLLGNLGQLKKDAWISYLRKVLEIYLDLTKKYEAAQERRAQIEKQAAAEQTQWEAVIEIFNDRFTVPFKLVATNRVSVVLGQEETLSLSFQFDEGEDSATLDRASLMRVLSTGERRAFYMLNVIFEIEARRAASETTLCVFDDIADSFDYKNKYAIIQYLMDVSEVDSFRQIILTHNFDFFRTINSRFGKTVQCLMAMKKDVEIVLEEATGIRNVFVNDWKKAFFTTERKRLASIPFIRNLIEYTRGTSDADYVRLTSLLHWKQDSAAITQGDLDVIFNALFGGSKCCVDPTRGVLESIDAEAQQCLTAGDGANLDNKIVLAIATRLAAEKVMIDRINDQEFVNAITANQTWCLFKKFREVQSGQREVIRTLQAVLLMTPENIHVNAFMYEPIIDMSDVHLRQLYRAVKALQ